MHISAFITSLALLALFGTGHSWPAVGNYIPSAKTVNSYIPSVKTVRSYIPSAKTVGSYIPSANTVGSHMPGPVKTLANHISGMIPWPQGKSIDHQHTGESKRIVVGSQSASKMYSFLYALITYDIKVENIEKGGKVTTEVNLQEEMGLQVGKDGKAVVRGEAVVNLVKAESNIEAIGEQPIGKGQAEEGAVARLQDAIAHDPMGEEYYSIESYIVLEGKVPVDYALVGCFKHTPGQKVLDKSKIVYTISEGVHFEKAAYDAAEKIGFKSATVGSQMEKLEYVTNNKDPHRDVGDHNARHVYLTKAVVECMEKIHAAEHPNKVKFLQVYIINKAPKPKHLQSESRMSTSVLIRHVPFENFKKEILKMVKLNEKNFNAGKIFLTKKNGKDVLKGDHEFQEHDYKKLLTDEHPSPVYVTEEGPSKRIVVGSQSASKMYSFLYALITYDIKVESIEKGGKVTTEVNLQEEMGLQVDHNGKAVVRGEAVVNLVKAESNIEAIGEQPIGKGQAIEGAVARLQDSIAHDPMGEEYYSIESYIVLEGKVPVDYALVGCFKHTPGQKVLDKSKIVYTISEGVHFEKAAYDAAEKIGFKLATVGSQMEKLGYVTNNKDPHRDVGPTFNAASLPAFKGGHNARHVYLTKAVVECMEKIHAAEHPNKVKFLQVYIVNKAPKPKHLQGESRMSTSVLIRHVPFENFKKEILKMVKLNEKKFNAGKIFLTKKKGEDVLKGDHEFQEHDFKKLLTDEHPSPVYVTEA